LRKGDGDRGRAAVSKPPRYSACPVGASSLKASNADAAEGLPKAEVELELQARLLLMKEMGQFHDDRTVLGGDGAAVVSGQVRGEILRQPWFAQPQANRH
jgi:hypothetical protein